MDKSPFLHISLSYEDIAAIAWEAMRHYAFLEGDVTFPSWRNLGREVQVAEVAACFRALKNPEKLPEDWHNEMLVEKAAEGWTFGYVRNEERKEDPYLVPWDEVRPQDRNTESIYWNTVMSIGLRAGVVDEAAFENRTGEDNASLQTKSFVQGVSNDSE